MPERHIFVRDLYCRREISFIRVSPTQYQEESHIPASEYPSQEVLAPKRERIIQLPSAPSTEVSPH